MSHRTSVLTSRFAGQKPPVSPLQLPSPVSAESNIPQSPAEHYIEFRSHSLNDSNNQQNISPKHSVAQSRAERYISFRSDSLYDSNNQQNISPKHSVPLNPLSVGRNATTTFFPMSHAELMQTWHQAQASKIHKKQPHRYVYSQTNKSSATAKYPHQLIITPKQQQPIPPPPMNLQKKQRNLISAEKNLSKTVGSRSGSTKNTVVQCCPKL